MSTSIVLIMKRGSLALSFAALATTLVNATESGTFATGVLPSTFTVDQGTIVLKMKPDADPNGSAYFRYLAPDGVTQKWIQPITSNATCGYVSLTSPYVAVSASGGLPGYLWANKDYALGVKRNASDASSGCAMINSGESLLLDFRPGLAANSYLDSASLDMEINSGGTVLTIQLYKDANPVYTYKRTCGPGECQLGSHYRINVPIAPQTVLFNRLAITVTACDYRGGAASLEGGSDPGTSPSTFHVVTQGTQITCTGPISQTGNGTTATIQFVPDPVTGCPTNKAYVLNVDTHQIELLTGGSTNFIQTIVTAAWAPEPRNVPIPENFVSGPPWDIATRIATVLPPTSGEPEIWCDATLANQPFMPSGHTWCRIMQTTKTVANGMMQVTETSLLQGDSKMIR